MAKRSLLVAIIFIMLHNLCFSQEEVIKKQLAKYALKSDSLTQKLSTEKLYLESDKSFYAIGDTIWFKVYLFKSAYLTASDKSGIAYIEVANDSNKVVKQFCVHIWSGLSWGNIAINDKDFRTGSYTIRAYTQWMRNQGDSCFFFKQIYINNLTETDWLIKTAFINTLAENNYISHAHLLFTDMDRKPLILKLLQISLKNGNEVLSKQTVQTDLSGVLDVNSIFPKKKRRYR